MWIETGTCVLCEALLLHKLSLLLKFIKSFAELACLVGLDAVS